MAKSPSAVTVNLGNPATLLRFVVAATLDGTRAPRAAILKNWEEHQGPTLATSQASLSRYLSPRGAPIPVAWAEALQAAANRVHGTATADASGLWSYRSFHRRLFPGEVQSERLGPEISAFTEITKETPRNNAELFHQAEALVELVRHSPTEDGWTCIDPEHRTTAWSIRDRLLAISCGGGAQAQRATTLLAELAVDRSSWEHITVFLERHPLGCKGVSILTTALQRETNGDAANRTTENVRLAAIVEQLRRRSEHEPPNEQLRAARGLFVEALGQLSPTWPLGQFEWLERSLAERALDTGRSARERAFAGLVYGKRFRWSATTLEIRDSLLDDANIDPVARLGIRRHFHLLERCEFQATPAGSERGEFYRTAGRSPWTDAASYLDPSDPQHRDVQEGHLAVASILEGAIDQYRTENDARGVPASVREATLGLLEAALYDIDAVARRVAVDTLRCATLARPAAAALIAVVTSPETRARSWVRCTALSALGLLQMSSPDLLDTLATTALEPGEDGDPRAVVKSSLLCLGDLLSEVGQDPGAPVDGETVQSIVDRLTEAVGATGGDAAVHPPPSWSLATWTALAYAVGSSRFAHPRLVELDARLADLRTAEPWIEATSTTGSAPLEYLRELIDRLQAEIYEVLLCDPARAVDPETVYRASEIFDGRSPSTPDTYPSDVLALAAAEAKSVTSDPIMHAASVATHRVALRRAVHGRRLDAPEPDEEELVPFQDLYRQGPAAMVPFYEAWLESVRRRPVIELHEIARLLSMVSEGATGQAGVDPTASGRLELSGAQREELGLDQGTEVTLFTLACRILVDRLTSETRD